MSAIIEYILIGIMRHMKGHIRTLILDILKDAALEIDEHRPDIEAVITAAIDKRLSGHHTNLDDKRQ